MEPTYTPHDETSLEPLNRLYEYLSGKVKTIVPKNEQELAARRDAISSGMSSIGDAISRNVVNAGKGMVGAGMVPAMTMVDPVNTAARILGYDLLAPGTKPSETSVPYSAANPADFMGAIPPSRRVRPAGPRVAKPGVPQVVTPPAGVLPVDEAMGAGGMYSGQASVDSMMAANPAPAASTPAAPQRVVEPVKTLRDEYIARMAGLNKPMDDKLTEQQKGMAILEASLAGLAAASKPGASMMGSIGQGGLVGTAAARDMQRVNREQAERRRAEDRATAAGEFAIAGQDIERQERAKRHDEDVGLRREDLGIRRDEVARRDKRDQETHALNLRKVELLEAAAREDKLEIVKSGDNWVAINKRNPRQSFVITGADGKPISARESEKEDPIVKRIKAIAKLTGDDVKDVAKSMIKDQSADAANELDANKILRRFPAEYLKSGASDPAQLPVVMRALEAELTRLGGKPQAGGANPQADAIRERFRKGEITEAQAVRELKNLGFK